MPPLALAPAALDRLFDDRRDAGRRLAPLLGQYARSDALVVALPCGGVPVGYEIARSMQLSMDVLPTKRIPSPNGAGAIGALAFGGEPVFDERVAAGQRFSSAQINDAIGALSRELGGQEHRFRSGRPPLDLHGRSVILVDDGVGTGWTIRAAISAVRARNPGPVVVAAPIASAWACAELTAAVQHVVCVVAPRLYLSVALWYRDFSLVPDREVERLLALSAHQAAGQENREEVTIPSPVPRTARS